MIRTLLFTLSFSVTASVTLEASDHLSCRGFERTLSFIHEEHIRFHKDDGKVFEKLLTEALAGLSDIAHAHGYHMLAAQFNESQVELDQESLCQSLGHAIYREFFLKAFVEALDPFSRFYRTQEFEHKTSSIDGSFVGVGIRTKHDEDGYVFVTEVLNDGPAANKLEKGDKLLKIDGRSTDSLSRAELRKRIRGSKGTLVHFTVEREEGQKLKNMVIAVERDTITQDAISYSWLEEDVVRIELKRFYEDTPNDLKEILETTEQRRRGIILDLRQNPGGLLHAARDIVDMFVDHGVVLHLRGGYEDQMWALRPSIDAKTPLVILVNERTASAAEIVAGALQDYGRALVVGTHTYGKSTVQNIYETQTALGIDYKGGLKLTTLWYYLPSGRSVQLFEPDIVVASAKDSRLQMPFEWPQEIEVIDFKDTAKRPIDVASEDMEALLKGKSEEELEQALLQMLAQTSSVNR